MNPIRADALKAHIQFLADDLLEGRAAGTHGFDTAALYVATQFELLGLKPAGDAGTYFQRVPVRHAQVVRQQLSWKSGQSTRELQPGIDFVVRADVERTSIRTSAPVVFVNYGVSAKDFGIDDYAGVDARGKFVLTFSGGAESLTSTPRAILTSLAVKVQNAAEHGAVGVIVVVPRPARLPQNERFDWTETDGCRNPNLAPLTVIAMTDEAATPLFGGQVSGDLMTRVRSGSLRPFDTHVEVSVSVESVVTDVHTANVIGIVNGSDPVLQYEYVVYTAHLDHLGVGTPVNGDAIYNGALDNAAGVAVMLEVARVLSTHRPPRSVVFVAATGEERGLLGSDFFAHSPTVPKAAIIANVNSDGANVLVPTLRDFVAFGAAESNGIDGAVRDAARALRLKVSADPHPQDAYFVRSDQYSFLKQGIPAVFVFPGEDSSEALAQFLKERYHKPADDISQPLHYSTGATWAHLQLLITEKLASTKHRPTLNPDDFLGRRFTRPVGAAGEASTSCR